MTALNHNTPVTNPITPGNDDRNEWATHYAKYGAGGFEIVANATEMNAITTERRVNKMVYRVDNQTLYHYNSSTWVPVGLGNGSVPQSVLDEIAANKAEIERLKTHPSHAPAEVFSYRGSTAPTLPPGKSAYYISFWGIKTNDGQMTLPSNAPEGVIVSVENQDYSHRMSIAPPDQTPANYLDGNHWNSVNLPAQFITFLIKHSDGWHTAFNGLLPASLGDLLRAIKTNLAGSLNSISDIQAALKDRLHTFAEIQKEFQPQLHTYDEIQTNLDDTGYRTLKVKYGFVDTLDKPTDDTWITGETNAAKSITLPIPQNAKPYLAFLVPIDAAPVVQHIQVGGSNQVTTSYEYTMGTSRFKYFVLNNSVTPSSTILVLFQFGIHTSSGGDSGVGLQGDESTEIFLGITDLDMPTSLVSADPNEDTKAVIQPYINCRVPIQDEENPGAMQEFKATSLQLLPPLNGFSDPNKPLGVIMEIDHNAYEYQHNPGFLAYLTTENIIPKNFDKDERFRKGAIWMDNIIVDGDDRGIVLDQDNKIYGIQEYDGKDPNTSGGTDFMLAFRVAFVGTAPNGGFIRVMFAKANAHPNDEVGDIYLTDKSGRILGSERYYTKGEDLGELEVLGVVNVTALQNFRCLIIHSITSEDGLQIREKEQGLTGLMIQCLTSVEKTGLALTQYELDTAQDINFTGLFLGPDRATFSFLLGSNQTLTQVPQGKHVMQDDGWGIYTISQIEIGVTNRVMVVDGDAHIHHIFNSDETRALRGKQIKVTTELTNEQTGYILALVSWTGKPDEYSPEVFKTRQILAPQFETGWAKVDQQIINVSVLPGFHIHTKVFTIPNNSNNYAIVLYPESDLGNAELHLKQLKVDVLNPFNTYYIHSTNPVHESHLRYDKEYRRLVQDTQGYASLRYTINNQPMPMPVGELREGKADISLDPTINIIAGSAAKGGEGAIKFNREGVATINTSFRVWSEQSNNYNVQFWYSKVSADGNTFTKIPDSDVVALIPKNAVNTLLKMPGFALQVDPGDRIALFAQSDIVDGAFIECNSDDKPMIDTRINFKELAADAGDAPGTLYEDDLNSNQFERDLATNQIQLKSSIEGLDLSEAAFQYTHMIIARYDFTNNPSVIPLHLDIPDNVTPVILSIHYKEGDYIKEGKQDYHYNTIAKRFDFAIGTTGKDGHIILGFLKNNTI